MQLDGRDSLTRPVKALIPERGGGWSLEVFGVSVCGRQRCSRPLPPGPCVRRPRVLWSLHTVRQRPRRRKPSGAGLAGPARATASLTGAASSSGGPSGWPRGRRPQTLPCPDRRQRALGEVRCRMTVRTPESMHICFSVFVFRKNKSLSLFSRFFCCCFLFFLKIFSSSDVRAGS